MMVIMDRYFIITFSTLLALSFACQNWEFKKCPVSHPQHEINMQEMVGSWYMTLLIIDATQEDFEEVDLCIRGDIEIYNVTTLIQEWKMFPTAEKIPSATSTLRTSIITPGVLVVDTPLGGQLRAIVLNHKKDEFAIVVHCGWEQGRLVHMWTSVITRNTTLTPQLRLHVTSALINAGYNLSIFKVVTWNKC